MPEFARLEELEREVHDLRIALQTRIVIEQAKGVLAERTGTTPAEAFRDLRRYARNSGTTLASVARAVIEGTLETARVRT